MEAISDFFIELIGQENNLLGLLIIGLSAMVEYVFPPFPGDTITLFGAALITAYSWSFFGVFGMVLAGSMVGSMLAFYLGTWLERRRERFQENHPEIRERGAALDALIEKFRLHGPMYLVINRFLPGIRALFFVAAGMAGMSPVATLVYSTISAAIWNLGIIALGSALGANFDTLLSWVRRYTMAAWAVIILATALFALRAFVRWQRARRN